MKLHICNHILSLFCILTYRNISHIVHLGKKMDIKKELPGSGQLLLLWRKDYPSMEI